MKELNSLFLVHSLYKPDILGGAEISTQLIADGMKDKLDVCVLTVGPFKRGEIKKDEIDQVTVYRLPYHNICWIVDKFNAGILRRFIWILLDSFNFFQYRKAKKIFKKTRPSIVHTQNLPGLSVGIWKAAHDLNIPIVHTLRDYNLLKPISSSFYSAIYVKYIVMPISKYVSGVVGISDFILKKHLEANLFKNSKKYVISNVVKSENLELETKVGTQDQPLRIGFFGQLTNKKGVEILIDAIKNIDANIVSEVYICGEGAMKNSLIEMAGSDKRIIFTGKLLYNQVLEKMRSMDLTIVPSVWEEPFGRVIIESYREGTPVLASNIGGIPEVVYDKTNALFTPGDSNSLRQLIIRYNNLSSVEKQKLRRACFNYSKLFSQNHSIQSYMKCYRDILSRIPQD